jgi:CRP/FNR family transcriptional regulator
MSSLYDLNPIASCLTCKRRPDHIFCNLQPIALHAFQKITCSTAYPKGAILFVEGQISRGLYVLCQGRVKLSTCTVDGRTLIVKLADPGDVLGLSATISGTPYELTAQTVEPCQVNFVGREDFLCFLRENVGACFRVAEQLSDRYNKACQGVRSLGLSRSAGEKLAKLLLDWSSRNGEFLKREPSLKMTLTHEEIAQLIGTSRETVTRIFADLKHRQILEAKGSTLSVRDKTALRAMAGAS